MVEATAETPVQRAWEEKVRCWRKIECFPTTLGCWFCLVSVVELVSRFRCVQQYISLLVIVGACPVVAAGRVLIRLLSGYTPVLAIDARSPGGSRDVHEPTTAAHMESTLHCGNATKVAVVDGKWDWLSGSGTDWGHRHGAVVSTTTVVLRAIPSLVVLDFENSVYVVGFDSCDDFGGCKNRGSKEDVDGRRLANRDTVVQVPS